MEKLTPGAPQSLRLARARTATYTAASSRDMPSFRAHDRIEDAGTRRDPFRICESVEWLAPRDVANARSE